NGTLGGDITVTNGVLGGSGTLSKVTVASGSTVKPGNSIGTLHTGDISFAKGSNYTVELKGGGNTAGTHNDWINASGTAAINGGSVFVTAENGADTGTSYQDGTVYTILTAAGGRTGEFENLSDDYAYLDFALSYDANNVYLTSDLAVSDFCLNGYTANQCATARGVQSLASGTVYNAVLNLSTGEAPDAIGQLSGEVYASTNTALFEDSRFARETSMDRLRQAMSGVGSDGNATTEQKISQDLALWGQGYGAWAHSDSDGNAYQMDRSTGGFLMGADALVIENVRAGVFAGYGSTQVDIPDLASTASIDTLTLGTYAGAQWGGLALRGGFSYSWHGIDTTRDVSFAGFSDSLSSTYDARTVQAYGEVGYTVALGEARFEPFANLAYVNLHSDGTGESGGAAALTLAEQSADATFVTLGMRADSKFSVGDVTATLRGTLGYRHAYGDTPVALARFASGGDAFTVSGLPLARDSLVVEGGVEFG
ncbi:autotransporter domain-containing protein, partial [Ciceribacter lividus]|uniref:autotransporter family protein n=1 Tax=Ciceribacter lividus TaxID=1197950 RepID=UPI000DF2AD6D